MPHWLKSIVEPRRLILAWQAADLSGDRYRWAVGEIAAEGKAHSFRYLQDGAEFAALNGDRSYSALHAAGYKGYPAFDPKKAHHHDNVMAAFRRRLPSRERSDYGEYLTHFRLEPSTSVSDFTLLGLTGAKLPSDGFSLVDPLEETASRRDLFVEVAGYRHYAKGVDLTEGDPVDFATEPFNEHDPDAVAIRAGADVIGYINRLRTEAFRTWIVEGRLGGVVERLNGQPDRPRAYVFVHVEPSAARAAA